jgi:hypothetical protein
MATKVVKAVKSAAKPAAKKAGKGAASKAKAPRVTVLVGTKKGLYLLHGDPARKSFRLDEPKFFGHVVSHVMQDPRDPKTVLAGVKTGHLGPTVFRTTDGGKTWNEAKEPPKFAGQGPFSMFDEIVPPKEPKPRSVSQVFWLTPSPASRPGEWWAGTVPHGMFRSKDAGQTWQEVSGFTEAWKKFSSVEGKIGPTPGGAITHSVIVDPRDPAHVYVSLSGGGTFESKDEGATWQPLNRGVAMDFSPEKDAEYGHDPHCVVMHPSAPDRLWQQNHCGIYRIERPGAQWDRIGKNMPKAIGDIGFPIVLHPRDTSTAWVLPMDGTEVWPRTSVGGRPAVFRTTDLGATWKRLDAGFPRRDAWWTVYRQGFAADRADPAGLYFGTAAGSVWASANEGDRWREIARDLPPIVSVTVAHGL